MLRANFIYRLSLTLVAFVALAPESQGVFIVIPQPTADYEASTTKFVVPNSGPAIQSLVAGDLTITFSGPMTRPKRDRVTSDGVTRPSWRTPRRRPYLVSFRRRGC